MHTLPPSSAVKEARFRPTMLPIARPARVPAVMSTFLINGFSTSVFPTLAPPGRTLRTAAGTPAFSAISASSRTVMGASSEGLTMTELPAARAGAIFLIAIRSGWLKG